MYIYKLTSSQTDQVYIGKSKKTINNRFTDHNRDFNNWCYGQRDFCSSFLLIQYDDVKIELIEETKNSLREIYWIRKLNSVNYNFDNEDYFIYKQPIKSKQGFTYVFQVQKRTKRIVFKSSVNKEFILKYRDDWIKNNPQVFME